MAADNSCGGRDHQGIHSTTLHDAARKYTHKAPLSHTYTHTSLTLIHAPFASPRRSNFLYYRCCFQSALRLPVLSLLFSDYPIRAQTPASRDFPKPIMSAIPLKAEHTCTLRMKRLPCTSRQLSSGESRRGPVNDNRAKMIRRADRSCCTLLPRITYPAVPIHSLTGRAPTVNDMTSNLATCVVLLPRYTQLTSTNHSHLPVPCRSIPKALCSKTLNCLPQDTFVPPDQLCSSFP